MANTKRTQELEDQLHYRYGYEDGLAGATEEGITAGSDSLYREGFADGVAERRAAELDGRTADI